MRCPAISKDGYRCELENNHTTNHLETHLNGIVLHGSFWSKDDNEQPKPDNQTCHRRGICLRE